MDDTPRSAPGSRDRSLGLAVIPRRSDRRTSRLAGKVEP